MTLTKGLLLPCLLLLTHVQGEALAKPQDHLNSQVQELREEMKASMKMIEMEQARMRNLIERLSAENVELKMKMQMKDRETKLELSNLKTSLSKSMSTTKEPQAIVCAFKNSWNTQYSTITYDKILTEHYSGGGEGQMDLNSGIYTVLGPAGTYSISFNVMSVLTIGSSPDHYSITMLHLHLNSKPVTESQWFNLWEEPADDVGSARQTGGRTMMLHLDLGDTLEINAKDLRAGELTMINFCVTLLATD